MTADFSALGHIHCRLLPESKELCELGKFMKQRWQSGQDPYFVIQDEHRGQEARQIDMTHEIIERMIRNRQFKMETITL